MKYIDITHTITTGIRKYPTDPKVEITPFKSLKRGDSCNLSKLTLGSHSGTHIDVPRHIIERGNTVDKIKLSNFFCDVVVINDVKFQRQHIFYRNNSRHIKGVLFKSSKNKAYLTIAEAKRLVNSRIKVVGTDQMSIENLSDKSHPVHRLLLEHNVIIIENLNLGKVKPGYYKLIYLPLKIERGDGAPIRALLAYN